jgi:hypothetical protein
MSHARQVNRRRRSRPDLKFEIRSDPSQSNHFHQPKAISVQTRLFAAPRLCVEFISPSTQPQLILSKALIYPRFHNGSFKPFQGKSRQIKVFQAYFPARLCHSPLRSAALRHASLMCASCAQTRISRAPSRDKCAFTGGKVRQCAVKCAHFSREAFSFKNSSCHQKSSLDAFLSLILCDFIRVISTDFDLIRLISSKITYTRARGFHTGCSCAFDAAARRTVC